MYGPPIVHNAQRRVSKVAILPLYERDERAVMTFLIAFDCTLSLRFDTGFCHTEGG